MKYVQLLVSLTVSYFIMLNTVFSKEIKPQVVVYGDNITAFAAALQSARSEVPTLWIVPSVADERSAYSHAMSFDENLLGGIGMDIRQELMLQHGNTKMALAATQVEYQPERIQQVIEKLAQEQKNLTILRDVAIVNALAGKKNITLLLSNKQKLTVFSVVDATSTMRLASFVDKGIPLNKKDSENGAEKSYDGLLATMGRDYIRTLLAVGTVNRETIGFTMQHILNQSTGNLFFTASLIHKKRDASNLVFDCNIGQAVGAVAAYISFFKTTSAEIDLRKVQSELLSFNMRILPFIDIHTEDPNFKALQRIFLVNILPWQKENAALLFNPLDSVSAESVRLALLQLYSRAQLWYIDNAVTYFSTKDIIELLKVIAFRGNDLEDDLLNAWHKRFKFQGEFNLVHTITRYEFAVLLDAYASPFAKRINVKGLIQR